MQSKKMWQALFIILFFLLVSAVLAWGCIYLFSKAKWQIFFGIGAGLMLLSVIPLFFYEKIPKSPAISLCVNSISCGLFLASLFIGKHLSLSLKTAFCSVLASGASFFIFMLLLSVPRLRSSRVYIVIVWILWAAALLTSGGILWSNKGASSYALFTLLSVAVVLFAVGSVFHSDSLDELLISLAIPSALAVGIIAVIVLLVLLQADDCGCDCDCCDGGCCDCTPDYEGGTRKKIKMSDLSAPPSA